MGSGTDVNQVQNPVTGVSSGENQEHQNEGTKEIYENEPRLRQLEMLIKNLEVKVNMGKDREKRQRQKSPGLEDGRCKYGWRGKKCRY